MQNELINQQLDILERRFQALRQQAESLPESREALGPGLQEVAQALAGLRAVQEAVMSPVHSQAQVLESMAEAVFIIDDEGVIIYANPAAYTLFGYQEGELPGQHAMALMAGPGAEKATFVQGIIQQLRGTGTWSGEVRNREKDGTAFLTFARISGLSWSGEKMWVAVHEDITARRHLEQTLQGYVHFIRLLLETIPNPIYYKDFQGIILGCNKAFAEFLEMPPGEIPGKALYDLFPGELARIFDATDQKALLSPGIKFYEELKIPAADGSQRQVVCHKAAFLDDGGGIGGVVEVITDITDLKRAEEALQEREATLRTLIEANPESLFLLDTQGVVLAASQVGAQRLRQSLDTIIGANIFALFPPDLAKERFESFQHVIATGQARRFEDSRGEFHFLEEITPVIDQGKVKHVAVMAVDITASKRAEEALENHVRFMRVLLDAIPTPIFYKDAQGAYLGCNKAFEDLMGMTRQEIVGKTLDEVHSKELADKYQQMDAAIFQNPGYQIYEWPLRGADGILRHVVIHKATFPDAAGQVAGLVGNIIDITDLKQAEEAVRESEARLRAIFEHAPVGITVVDPTGRFLQTNPAFQEIVGYSETELQRMTWQQLTLPEDLPKEMLLQEQLIGGQRHYCSKEKRYLRKNGDIVWVSMMLSRLWNARGEVRVVGIIIDITAKKRAEEDLRASEQRFRLMAETTQDAFWIGTADFFQLMYVSPGYERIWGRSKEKLYSCPMAFMEAVHPEDLERVKAHFVSTMAHLGPWSHEYRIIRPDGEIRWIHDRGSPIRNEQGQVILLTGVCADITERKTLEQQLILAQKMEAVGRLAGGVAHDFNNLLMAISSYAEIMQQKILKGDPLYSYLEDIFKVTERAMALTKQLLTFSRQQVVRPRVIDLNRALLDLKPMLRRLIAEDIELRMIHTAGLGKVRMDPGYLNQIIMNLVINARDALPSGGQILVTTTEVNLDTSRQTRFGVVPPGTYTTLEVSDNGIGIAEEVQAHIFEPFFTTKEPGKGTGLGLSLVYGIVKQSGGFIDLESAPGLGSTFSVFLPRLEVEAEPAQVKTSPQQALRGEETILLVEDEEVLRTLLGKFLRLYGYTVLEARHGDEAMLICGQHQGPIHLMVTDVVMPQVSGRVLADRLRPLRPEMKVLYMSGYTEDEVVQRGVADLSVAFLQKPFKPVELARQVQAVLHPPASD